MNKRKGISKKIRFEVFKRDKFTCQYCGQKSPDVVLHVDHINPVAGGGDNDLMNLITSCFECNIGKKDRLLSDESVLGKQRKQMELLQEKREQIEMMYEWKKTLASFDDEQVNKVEDYINNKIEPYTISKAYKNTIKKLFKSFSINQILEAVDLSFDKYIHYESSKITQESVEVFLDKIGGILHIQKMSPVDKKLAYIKGIAKNRFNYYDPKRAVIALGYYRKALLEYGYSEDEILNDLSSELEQKTKETKNWSEWINLINKWTEDIKNWKKEEERVDYSKSELYEFIEYDLNYFEDKISAYLYISKDFPEFEKDKALILNGIYSGLIDFLQDIKALSNDEFLSLDNQEVKERFITRHMYEGENLTPALHCDYETELNPHIPFYELQEIRQKLLEDMFEHFYYPKSKWSRENINMMCEESIEMLSKKIVDLSQSNSSKTP